MTFSHYLIIVILEYSGSYGAKAMMSLDEYGCNVSGTTDLYFVRWNNSL